MMKWGSLLLTFDLLLLTGCIGGWGSKEVKSKR
jgi:hypothetical protein